MARRTLYADINGLQDNSERVYEHFIGVRVCVCVFAEVCEVKFLLRGLGEVEWSSLLPRNVILV